MKLSKLSFAQIKQSKPAKLGLAGIATLTTIGGIVAAWNSISSTFKNDQLNANDIVMDFRLAPYNDENLLENYPFIWANSVYNTTIYKGMPIIENKDVFEYYSMGFKASSDLYDVTSYFSNHEFPIFDLKIINNGNKTLVIDNLIINVEKSEPDLRPMPVIGTLWSEGDLFKCAVINQGWGNWKECTFEYNLKGGDYENEQRITIPPTDSPFIIDIEPLLKQSGINTNYFLNLYEDFFSNNTQEMPNMTEALLAVGNCYVVRDEYNMNTVIDGSFEYIDDIGNETIIRASFFVPLMIEGLGDGFDPGNNFIVELKPESENYNVEFPTSFTVEPNGTERFLISMATRKSSWHTFSVSLGNINDIKLKTNETKLYIFAPRSLYNSIDAIRDYFNMTEE